MITKAEPTTSGPFSVLDSVVSKVERATDYIADVVLGSDDDNDDDEDDDENTIPDDEREPDDYSVASADSNGSGDSISVFTCGSATCGSVDDASIGTLTLADQQEYVIEKPVYAKNRVKVDDRMVATNKPEASTIGNVTLIPFVVEEPGLLGIQIRGVTTNNIAYVVDVPSTCNTSCKELRPGDVLARYHQGYTERPKPYTLAEFTYLLVSNKRPLRFVAIRSSNM